MRVTFESASLLAQVEVKRPKPMNDTRYLIRVKCALRVYDGVGSMNDPVQVSDKNPGRIFDLDPVILATISDNVEHILYIIKQQLVAFCVNLHNCSMSVMDDPAAVSSLKYTWGRYALCQVTSTFGLAQVPDESILNDLMLNDSATTSVTTISQEALIRIKINPAPALKWIQLSKTMRQVSADLWVLPVVAGLNDAVLTPREDTNPNTESRKDYTRILLFCSETEKPASEIINEYIPSLDAMLSGAWLISSVELRNGYAEALVWKLTDEILTITQDAYQVLLKNVTQWFPGIQTPGPLPVDSK